MSAGEGLRAKLLALADEWENPGEVYALRMSAAPRLRALLAETAPVAQQRYRRGPDDGFDVAGKGLVTHADYTTMTAALEFGDDHTEPAATPAELLPYLQAAFAAQLDHQECERGAEPAPVADEGQAAGLGEAEIDLLDQACYGAGEYMCCVRSTHRKTGEPVGGSMLDAVERILAARGATRDGTR